jgi:transposase, IS5 family
MDRNFLIGSHGDAANAVLAAVGYNFRRLVAWLKRLLCVLLMVFVTVGPNRTDAALAQSS